MEATLSVILPATAIGRGEHPTITLRILNRSRESLWINGRMLLASEHEVSHFHEVWLEIVAPDQKKVPFGCRIRAGDATPQSYRVLAPQEAHESKQDLRCFDFDQVGRYKIIAHYRDGSDYEDGANSVPPPPPRGAIHLSGDLASEPVFLEITEKPSPTSPSSGPTTNPVPSAAMNTGNNTFAGLTLSLPSSFVLGDDTREEVPSLIPVGPPAVEYFRSYSDGGAPVLHFFAWDGTPARDRGPMKAVESWKVPVDGVIANVSRTSHFFGHEREVLVAHFAGPRPAERRYMIYTTRIDKGAFEAVLQRVRFSPAP